MVRMTFNGALAFLATRQARLAVIIPAPIHLPSAQ